MMKYQPLGKTDVMISAVTHGCMELGGGKWFTAEKEHNIALLRTAFDHGITTFDTAEGYGAGRSEEIVGEALKGMRDRCVICTKVLPEHLRAQDVRISCEGSLRRLGTDYIDLLYIHWPNSDIPLEETLGEMDRLREEGKIRAIGVSNFNLPLMQKALSITRIDALQPEFNLLERKIQMTGVLRFCSRNEISVLSYNSIAKGILSGAFHFYGARLDESDFRNQKPLFSPENMEIERPLLELLAKLAAQYNVSISRISIAWVLAQKGISSAIVGTQNEKHFLDNLGAVDVELSAEDLEALTAQSEEILPQLVM